MWANKLKFNLGKTECCLSVETNCGIGFQSILDGVALLLKDQLHSLKVFLEKQVVAATRSAFAHCQHMHQLWPFLNKADPVTATHPLVTCNALHRLL